MKRPLLLAQFFLIAGILAGQMTAGPASVSGIGFFVCVFAVCAALVFYFRKPQPLLLLALSMLGFFLFLRAATVPEAAVERLAKQGGDVVMSGVALDTNQTRTGRQKIIFRLETVKSGTESVQSRVKLTVVLPEGQVLLPGQRAVLQGEISKLDHARNPGGFDEYAYYKARRVSYKSFPEVLEKGEVADKPAFALHTVRNRLAAVYDACLPSREAGLLKSMVIGDKTGLEDDLADLYRQAGIYHIICISGLHLVIIGMALEWLLTCFLPKKQSCVITLGTLIFYCMLTGNGVATVRAVIMTGVMTGGSLLHRGRDVATSAAFAAMCLLIYQPLYLWDVGFQYSFSAVFGLALCTKPVERAFRVLAEKAPFVKPVFNVPVISDGLAGSTAASLATVPVMIAHFDYILPYSLLVNALIVPTVSVTTVTGFAVGLFGLVAAPIGKFLSGVPFLFLRCYELICQAFIALPGNTVLTGRLPVWMLILWILALAFFVWLFPRKGRPARGVAAGFMVSAVAFVLAVSMRHVFPAPLQVAFLDVGQGDALAISNNRFCVLIDGGGHAAKPWGENTGETVLIPFLNEMGVGRVDAAFVTHGDMDHIGGIIELVDAGRVSSLILSKKTVEGDGLRQLLLKKAAAAGVPVRTVSAGDDITVNDVTFRCLYPFDETEPEDINGSSLVLRLERGEASFLFTGDVGTKGEAAMLAAGENVDADVMKLAHHGSKYSSNSLFIRKVSPDAAIVSAGRQNRYGHPDPVLVEALTDKGISVYNTMDEGAVILQTDGKTVWLKPTQSLKELE